MAHYAFIDQNKIVIEVIVGKNESEDGIDWEQHYGTFRGQRCLRTSYNTIGGQHAYGGTPFRKNYACIGHTYNEDLDAFVSPKPYASWLLNETTAQWDAPVPLPEDSGTGEPPKRYRWDETAANWITYE